MSPLYNQIYELVSRLFVLDYSMPFLYIEGRGFNFTAKPGEVMYMDKHDDQPKYWLGDTVPGYWIGAVYGPNAGRTLMHCANAKVSIQHAQNPMVYMMALRAVEAMLMSRHCAWYKNSQFARPHSFAKEFATIDNLRLSECDSKYKAEQIYHCTETARVKVQELVNKRFLEFNPITQSEADIELGRVVDVSMATFNERLVSDLSNSDDMLLLQEDLFFLILENIGSIAPLESLLQSNRWGVYEFNLVKGSTTMGTLEVTYRGDYLSIK